MIEDIWVLELVGGDWIKQIFGSCVRHRSFKQN